MTMQEAHTLLPKLITGEHTSAELQEFEDWLKNGSEEEVAELMESYYDALNSLPFKSYMPPDFPAELRAQLQEKQSNHSVRKIHFLKTAWFKYAAAIIILLGAGAYLWLNLSEKREVATTTPIIKKDIEPGGDKAILTLADGSEIVLDSAANGSIAEQGGMQIVKQANGEIVYNLKSLQGSQAVMNTIRTPKGGKYQLIMPDGTKVWLNAASSITFPVTFVGKDRSVKITGEVYFEVAKDKVRPFLVNNGNTDIQVLGTNFNVNAYEDEEDTKITLLQGSIRVSQDQSQKSIILVPGQQAQVFGKELRSVDNADLGKVMAWKNGLFNFEDAQLEDVMRQISRWYDIEVKYEKGVPDIQLWGKMSRTTSLSGMLKNLKDVGVRYRMNEERRELIILP